MSLFIDLVPVGVAFIACICYSLLYLYGDYIQHPVICLDCRCCFGVNYNVVICKALSFSGVESLSVQ